jgi:hypothetical protein
MKARAVSRIHQCTCSRAWSTIRGRCAVCKGERLGSQQLELGDDMIGHLIFYPRTAADGPRGFAFDHVSDLDPSGRCGGSVIWENADGSKGRFTLVSTEPIELAEPIICRCGLAGRIVAGKWAPLDETSPAIMLEFGRPHSKGRERQGAERRASAELDDSMPRESLCC